MAIVANGLLIAGMLGACQNENQTAPVPQSALTTMERNAKTAVAPQLIKDGDKILEYSTNALGRKVLVKVTNPGTGNYFTFTYTPQAITVKSYAISTNNYLSESLYKLDAAGRCYESSSMNKLYGYEYNADGQLSKRYSKIDVNERTEFVYKVFPGSNFKALEKVSFYDKFNKQYREVIYNYGANQDLTLVNPDSFCDISSFYLHVFGQFNTNLPSIMYDETGSSYNKTTQGWQLEYTFNADGTAKTVSRKIIGSNNPTIIERKYSAPLAQ